MAVTIAAEPGQISCFESVRQLMGYCGVVASEDSSGKRTRRESITKTGNAHLRRIVVEAAWSYQRPRAIWAGLRKRQQSASEEAKETAWKAQHRLYKRHARVAGKAKDKRKIVTAVGRELLGFIWAIGDQSGSDCKADNSRLTKSKGKSKSKSKTFLRMKKQKR